MRPVNFLTPDFVRQCFRYDDGKLFWIKRPREHFPTQRGFEIFNGKFPGKEAGTMKRDVRNGELRYFIGFVIGNRKLNYARSRLIYCLCHGVLPDCIDHRNGDQTDDRIENLRSCTLGQNLMNSRRHRDSTSGFKGVSFNKRLERYEAYIWANNRKVRLGYFDDPEVAHQAYVEAAEKYFGEFARTE